MSDSALTTTAFWDGGYHAGAVSGPLMQGDFRRFPELEVAGAIERLGLAGRRVVEIGAGGSALLTYLARRHGSTAAFTGLDYAPEGCRLLRERARQEGVDVAVVEQDLFAPDASMLGQFDVAFSIGVVEHFTDLAGVLGAMKRFLAPGGVLFTLVPNVRGVPGALMRRYNHEVHALHVSHDLASLRAGHEAAGLAVTSAFRLCSTNFGMLSICFRTPADPGYRTYVALSRVSKALWWFESRIGNLPALPALSPYLVVMSRS